MARGTKKAGISGKFGPRYGVTIRKRIKDVSSHRLHPQQCPECHHNSVKRESTGIWVCRRCNLKFAAAAYTTRTRSFKKDESISVSDRAYRADEDNLEAVETAPGPEEVEEETEELDAPEETEELHPEDEEDTGE